MTSKKTIPDIRTNIEKRDSEDDRDSYVDDSSNFIIARATMAVATESQSVTSSGDLTTSDSEKEDPIIHIEPMKPQEIFITMDHLVSERKQSKDNASSSDEKEEFIIEKEPVHIVQNQNSKPDNYVVTSTIPRNGEPKNSGNITVIHNRSFIRIAHLLGSLI